MIFYSEGGRQMNISVRKVLIGGTSPPFWIFKESSRRDPCPENLRRDDFDPKCTKAESSPDKHPG